MIAGFLSFLVHSYGNGLEIANVTPNADYTSLSFDISWHNSWRQSERFHDAVWVFVKYLPANGTQYLHGHVSGGTGGNGLEVVSQPDSMGVFIRNVADFTGDIGPTTITLDILLDQDLAIHPDFKVYGLEMVYVPEGPFYLGDGDSTSLMVWSSPEMGLDQSASFLYYPFGKNHFITHVYDSLPLITGPSSNPTGVAKEFPNGYNDFYCMKYPFTREMFAEYLNQLVISQQTEIFEYEYQLEHKGNYDYPFGYNQRQGIYVKRDSFNLAGGYLVVNELNDDGVYNNFDDGQNIAASFKIDYDVALNTDATNWPALKGYLSMLNWSGLRPMTELEFEKACRGPLYPVYREYAWGGTFPTGLIPENITNGGQETENYSLSGGPFIGSAYRVGMFADDQDDRLAAQASYWGIQDLSGNGFPILVSIDNSTFTGEHGNGLATRFPTDWALKNPLSEIFKFATRRGLVSERLVFKTFSGIPQFVSPIFPNQHYTWDLQGRGVRKP